MIQNIEIQLIICYTDKNEGSYGYVYKRCVFTQFSE